MTGFKVGQFGEVHADAIDGDGGNITLYASDTVALSSDSLTTANAGLNGDGGKIIVFSPDTALFWENAKIEARGGTLSGDGGFVEVSGKKILQFQGHVDTSAMYGVGGTILLDPWSIEIVTAGAPNDGDWNGGGLTWEPTSDASKVSPAAILGVLNANTVIIDATVAGAGTGQITVTDAIDLSDETGILRLQAETNIDQNAAITNIGSDMDLELLAKNGVDIGANITGAGDITINADSDGNNTGSITRSAGTIGSAGADLVLQAGEGIGTSPAPIVIAPGAAGSLNASSTGTGDIYITATGAVGSVTLTTNDGDIDLTSKNSMTIDNVSAGGTSKNVTLTTTASTADIDIDGNITALGDTVTLTARNVDDDLDGTTDISAATLTITATGHVGASSSDDELDTDVDTINVNAAGDVYIIEESGVNLNNVSTTDGTIVITTAGDTTLTDVAAGGSGDEDDVSVTASTGDIEVDTVSATGSGDVTIEATTGAIVDANDDSTITGDLVTLTAQDEIGATGGLDINTTATTLNVSSTSAGDIYLAETDAVTLSDVDTVNGGITISAGGALTATDVDAAGSGKDVNLSTTTGGMVLTSVTADDDITCTADAGDITIGIVGDAGTDDISITATAGSINATADNAAVEVTAPTINLSAASGIGDSNNGLDISGTTITADVTGDDADIDIDNTATAATTATLTTTGDDGAAGSDILFEQTGGFTLALTATTTDGDITASNTGANLTATAVNAGNATTESADGNVTLSTVTTGDIIATDIDAAGTTVYLTSVGGISVGDINASAATVTLAADGAITDTDDNMTDITAINLVIRIPVAETYYMRVTYVLWGQGNYGDCIFIELPGADGILDTADDKNVLIDGGGHSTTTSKLDDFLTEKGVSVINYMVMSHPAADHYYGLYMVVRDDGSGMGLSVDYFYEVRNYTDLLPDRPIYDALRSHFTDEQVYNPTPGDYLSWTDGSQTPHCGPGWDPNLVVRCLAADLDEAGVAAGEDTGSNNCSMMLVAKMGSSCFLFGGDAESGTDTEGVPSAEQYAVDNYPEDLADVHIYKVHHQGSDTSSGSALLNAMTNLRYAIQQDGGSYDYHPNEEALDRITDAGAVIYRNDLDGDVLIKCDDSGNYDITREVCYDDPPWSGFHNDDDAGIYPPPALPTNLSVASSTANSITLDWDDVTGATYDVFRSTTNNGDNGAGRHANPGCDASTGIYEKIAENVAVSNYTDSTVNTGTTYYYRVSSKKVETDGDGNQFRYERRYSNQASGTPSGAGGGVGASGTNNELDTDVDTITATVTGDIYILEKDAVTLSDITTSGGLIDIEAGGDITINTVTANTSATLVSTGGSIYDASLLSASATSYLKALGGIIGTKDNPVDVNINGGDLWVYASSSRDAISVNIAGTVSPSDTLRIGTPPIPPGLVLFNNRMMGGGNIIALQSRALGELHLSGVDTVSLYYNKNLRPWEYRTLLPWELGMGYNIIDNRFLLGPSALIDTSAIE